MKTSAYLALVCALLVILAPVMIDHRGGGVSTPSFGATMAEASGLSIDRIERRRQADFAAMKAFRPGYPFWENIFSIRDGRIVFGSAVDGRALVVFPTDGDWVRRAKWLDTSLSSLLDGHTLPKSLDERREYVAHLLEQAVGPVLHNETRGDFATPGIRKYGAFFGDWSAIYQRFGVPAEIGLAQALLESGFEGRRRSEADAVGLCQWLESNWKHLDRLDPAVIESGNQTTQAAYCAAYLSVLATKYGSFIPALSEHHAGGTNIGRILVLGARLGGDDARDQYLRGADFARDLRSIAHDAYGDIYESYGPRSYRYAEIVFGNTRAIHRVLQSTAQTAIHAMRTSRAIMMPEITARTGLSADEVRRYNPALVSRVPAGATLYLPVYVASFGEDVSFWRAPASAEYLSVLDDFVRLNVPALQWDRPSFGKTLREFERRFRDTNTEEGAIMATVLAYVRIDAASSARREILADFQSSADIHHLFERGRHDREIAETLAAE